MGPFLPIFPYWSSPRRSGELTLSILYYDWSSSNRGFVDLGVREPHCSPSTLTPTVLYCTMVDCSISSHPESPPIESYEHTIFIRSNLTGPDQIRYPTITLLMHEPEAITTPYFSSLADRSVMRSDLQPVRLVPKLRDALDVRVRSQFHPPT